MLRAGVRGVAATVARTAASCESRAFTSTAPPISRYMDNRAPTQKQREKYYSRIAAKLDKTRNHLSLESVDRVLAYLHHLGLTKNLALSAVAMHPMVRFLVWFRSVAVRSW